MAVLATNTPLRHEVGNFNELPVAASTKIYQGAMVGLTSGYARGLVAGDTFVGHANAIADNSSGNAGDIKVQVLSGSYLLQVTLASVAVTSVGANVYASDNGTLTLSETTSLVGKVARYVTTNTAVVRFVTGDADVESGSESPSVGIKTLVQSFDCQADADSLAKTLIPASENVGGLVVLSVFARVTEVFGGATEDQGVVTVRDEDENAIATLTPSDAGADAIGDIIQGYQIGGVSTGAALKTVAAGKAIEAIVSTETDGSGAAGKMSVYITVLPLA